MLVWLALAFWSRYRTTLRCQCRILHPYSRRDDEHLMLHYTVQQLMNVKWDEHTHKKKYMEKCKNTWNELNLCCSNNFARNSSCWCVIGFITILPVSETLGDGTTENVVIMRSGYSSRMREIRSVPIPLPVPPPSECVNWKPFRLTEWNERKRRQRILQSKDLQMEKTYLKAIASLGFFTHHIQYWVH